VQGNAGRACQPTDQDRGTTTCQLPHQRRCKSEKVAKAKGSFTGKYFAPSQDKRVVAD